MFGQGGRADVSRRLISLSRQGGVSLKDQYDKKKQDAGNKKGSGSPTAKKPTKSASAPTLLGNSKAGGTMTGSMRTGGGWSRNEMTLDLTKYRELLDDVAEWNLNIDFCEKPYNRTALWEAAWKNHYGIVKLLASKGANIAAPDFQGRTPLHEAAYYGHLNLVYFFVEKGHPLDCVDEFGQTPLFRASEGGRSDIVKYLIEQGANANLLDSHNVNASHVSAFQGRQGMAEYLRFNGAFRNRYQIGEESGMMKSRSDALKSALKSTASLVLAPSRKRI